MGSWHETCGLTNLPINEGTPCRIMFIRVVPQTKDAYREIIYRPFDIFQPVSNLARGKYNDYGWLHFAPGERNRLLANTESLGIKIVKKADSLPEVPPNIFQVIIREDAFQMLAKLPVDHWSDTMPKTVGGMVGVMRDRFAEYLKRRKEVPEDEEDKFEWREQNRPKAILDAEGDHTRWPLREAVIHAYFYKDKDAEFDLTLFNDYADLMQIYHGFNCMRRLLMPTTTGMASQHFNTEAINIFADFMKDTAKKWDNYLNEEDGEVEDDVPDFEVEEEY
jgi:hypothetical protein